MVYNTKVDKHTPHRKSALRLLYITIAWNVFEGLACVAIGLLIQSVSLFAYGLESSVEVFSSAVALWDIKSEHMDKKREEKALRMIGLAYLVVSAYVFIDAAKSFLSKEHPQHSFLGILLMVVTAIMMIVLGLAKKAVGKKMGSLTLLADAKFTLVDAALASTVLVGLVFNTLFGWWWMDQMLALFLAGVAFREGIREIL